MSISAPVFKMAANWHLLSLCNTSICWKTNKWIFLSRITPLFHHLTTSVISIHCFAVPVVLSAVIYSCLLLSHTSPAASISWTAWLYLIVCFCCIFSRYCAVLEFDIVPYLCTKSWSEAVTGLSVSQILRLVSLTALGNKNTWQCYSNYISIWHFYISAAVKNLFFYVSHTCD